jgi:hypothetical protein
VAYTIPVSASRDWEIPRRTSVNISGVLAEVRTEHLLNKSQEISSSTCSVFWKLIEASLTSREYLLCQIFESNCLYSVYFPLTP